MRLKLTGLGLLLVVSFALVFTVGAQDPSIEWKAWNTQITAHANSDQLDIAETQVINVTAGPLHGGERSYSQHVDIQSVYLSLNGGQPQQLSEGVGGIGSYQINSTSSDVVLDYTLPNAANTGDSFAIQINYSVPVATAGLIDWFAVPGDHPFPVDSSTVTINFPDGEMPSTDFVRMPQGTGTVTTEGNSIVIRSQGVIPADQAFEVQTPFGAGVGDAGSTGNTSNNPVQSVPPAGTGTSNDTGLGSLLPILCILGVVLLLGGRGILGSLLGGLGGGLLGGNSGGLGGNPYGNQPSGPFGGTSPTSSRGFRESPNQNREVPAIREDKERGGGARFR